MANSLKGAGLRYSSDDGVPDWAVGKTADDILAMATNAANHIRQISAAPPAYNQNVQPIHAPAPAPPPHELAYENPIEYARQYDAYSQQRIQTELAQVGAPVFAQLSTLARAQSKSGRHADIWRRWEPEIDMQLSHVPAQMRTVELYDQAAAIVKSNHVDEIAREQAERLAANVGAGTERGSQAGSPQSSAPADPLEAAFASGHPFFEDAKRNGMTPENVRNYLRQTGTTADEYIANATRGSIVVTPDGYKREHV